jgi:hypothetical protein
MTITRAFVAASLAAVLLHAAPAAAKTHVPLWDHGFQTVSAVTPSTVVVKHAAGLEQQLPTGQITVQAAVYPADAGILRPGERVNVFQEMDRRPLVVVHPSAFGRLQKTGSIWTVTSKRRGTVALNGTNPQLYGMREWKAGERVMVFGPMLGPDKVDVAAVAAAPLLTRSTVQSATAATLTLKSDQYGTLTYRLDRLPSVVREQFRTMAPGDAVIASLNPLNRQVLMVWPDHMERWAKTLERGTAGQVVAVSPKDITLTNHLGTVTIPLNHTVTIRWKGRRDAKITDVTPGTRIVAVRDKDGSLKIMVRGK